MQDQMKFIVPDHHPEFVNLEAVQSTYSDEEITELVNRQVAYMMTCKKTRLKRAGTQKVLNAWAQQQAKAAGISLEKFLQSQV